MAVEDVAVRDQQPFAEQAGALEHFQRRYAVSVQDQFALQHALRAVKPHQDVALARRVGGGAHEVFGEGLDAARQQNTVDERIVEFLRVVEEPQRVG
nr:hypothetical protein [Amycolatopsis rubida]